MKKGLLPLFFDTSHLLSTSFRPMSRNLCSLSQIGLQEKLFLFYFTSHDSLSESYRLKNCIGKGTWNKFSIHFYSAGCIKTLELTQRTNINCFCNKLDSLINMYWYTTTPPQIQKIPLCVFLNPYLLNKQHGQYSLYRPPLWFLA